DEGRQYPGLMAAAANRQLDLAPLGERLRQAGLYVDFLSAGKDWLSPRDLPKSETDSWKARLEVALARVSQQADLGLFSPRALEIQREVYGPINADRPRRKDAKPDDERNVAQKALAAHRDYYRRLVEERILDRDADIQV